MLAPAITLFPSWLTASTGSRLRVAFIGMGEWGQQYLRTALLHKDIAVHAVCEHDTAALQQAKQIFRSAGMALPALYNEGATDYTKLLTRRDIDAVIIATPWQTHYEIAKAALLAGKHVACGAIMGSTVEEHWDIVNTSKQTGKQYVTLDELSYRPELMAITSLVKEGKLGELQTIHAGADYAALNNTTISGTQPYPVYPAAATADLLGISATNQYISLSVQERQQSYVISKADPKTGKPQLIITNGLVNSISLGTSNNQSVLFQSNFNTHSFSTGFWLQATGGHWTDLSKSVQITGEHAAHLNLNSNHPQGNIALALHDFVNKVRQPTEQLAVCAAATNSVIGTLAGLSAAQNGATIQFPDFYS
ncbi:Oxidoreductase family, NAD-binding Rossmann fold [Niastella yeongjuensis]|nr:Oxidoreductase family, NAD-binding Rossmann fold [Niastella yeongjuensis]